jgi:hypothetical protein
MNSRTVHLYLANMYMVLFARSILTTIYQVDYSRDKVNDLPKVNPPSLPVTCLYVSCRVVSGTGEMSRDTMQSTAAGAPSLAPSSPLQYESGVHRLGLSLYNR